MKAYSIALSALAASASLASAAVIDFEDLTVPASGYENGEHLSGSFTSHGAVFNNYYDETFGPYWEGFSYSTKGDTVTAGNTNQYSAYSGGGSGATGNTIPGNVFAVGFTGGFVVVPTITLSDTESSPLSLRVTNTTYAALSMLNGDGFAKKFGGATGNDPDFFKLTITALNAGNATIGAVDVFLADYRFGDNSQDYILNTWKEVNLSSFGAGVSELQFALASTDNGMFGMNTPAYFAVDHITATPEPSVAGLSLVSLAMLALRRPRGK